MSDTYKDSGRPRELESRYANYFQIGYNEIEFLLDCGQLYPEAQKPVFHTRITVIPLFAKELLETLRESVRQYESKFGPIKD